MFSLKKRAILTLISIFLIGVVIGILFDRYVLDTNHPRHPKKDPGTFLFDKLTKELKLNSEQQEKLRQLLERSKEKQQQIRESNREDFKRAREEFDSEFRLILTEEQRIKFEELTKKWEQEYRERREHSRR